MCAACSPLGGGRNSLSARLVRHFAVFNIPPPNEPTLQHIFSVRNNH